MLQEQIKMYLTEITKKIDEVNEKVCKLENPEKLATYVSYHYKEILLSLKNTNDSVDELLYSVTDNTSDIETKLQKKEQDLIKEEEFKTNYIYPLYCLYTV